MSGGNEVFYLENGQKRDGDIHHPILEAAGDDIALRRKSFAATVALGVDPAAAARFYGLPEGYDLSDGGPSSLR